MAFVEYNANPNKKKIGDCVIRAISVATGSDWEHVFIDLAVQAFTSRDMPNANHVWSSYLQDMGFTKHIIPNTCPNCYTVRDFCKDNPSGVYILATGSHVIPVIGGDYYDTWDSGDQTPIYYFRRN